jgi:hypothetical protein
LGVATSSDGTAIAYERSGRGSAVILVGGGVSDRSENAPLAAELAEQFTVYNYDRRGRGESGDVVPYAVEREIEDLEALIAAAGGSAHSSCGSRTRPRRRSRTRSPTTRPAGETAGRRPLRACRTLSGAS